MDKFVFLKNGAAAIAVLGLHIQVNSARLTYLFCVFFFLDINIDDDFSMLMKKKKKKKTFDMSDVNASLPVGVFFRKQTRELFSTVEIAIFSKFIRKCLW